MAPTAETMKLERSISRRIVIWAATLLSIFVFSGLLLALNYWLAVIFFFVSLLLLIRFGLDEHEWRGLWLLLVTYFFVAVLVGSLALLRLSNDSSVLQLAQNNAVANIFLGGEVAIVLTCILIGVVGAFISVVIPFLLLVAIANVGILKWHKKDPQISFWTAYWYLLVSILGIFYFWVIVDSDGEIRGRMRDKERLENFGGPGWLTVYQGQVVVLHHWGKVTRVVGLGSTVLKREEQIKAVLPLTAKGGSSIIKNVLTRDRIPLEEMIVGYAAQIELAAETKARLEEAVISAKTHLEKVKRVENMPQEEIKIAERKLKDAEQQLKELEGDQIIGDDYNQCYESIAKRVAIKAPDGVTSSLKAPVENNLRDAIMSEYFENLFGISEGDENLETRISFRRIAEIEKIVFEKAKQAKIGDGAVLKVVDIQQVRFPEKIGNKLQEEVNILIEERIQRTKVRLEESKAKATVIEARAKAQAKILDGQGEGESRAAEFREILRELKREEALPRDQIANAVLQLISTKTSIRELESFLKATAITRRTQSEYGLEEANGSQQR